jgi:surface antigen
MTKNKEKTKKNKRLHLIRRGFPYVVVSAGLIAVAFFGSQDKFDEQSTSIDMRALAQNNFAASADQAAEMYIVSELADSMNSATAPVIKINYDSITSAISYASSTSTEKLEKPNVVDTSHLAAGVIKYEVKKGETIESIAEKYSVTGVTATMIRWSNGMKASQNVSAGKTIYVPGRAGFAYTVRNGDTVKNLAVKYQSTAEEIIAANSLELDQNLKKGMVILIPDGVLPDNERPDYVPKRRSSYSYVSYAYSAQYSAGNRYARGWCTWYAWSKRPDLPSNMGNARNWANAARRAGFPVSNTPQAGDVFQTTRGGSGYGHVGYVTGVNADGSVNVCDMNGIAGWGRVGCGTWSRSKMSGYNFIHRK